MRYVVESDMRFEHCYRIDEDSRTPVASKRACWAEWKSTYTQGQEASRVAYATERLRILDGAAGGAAAGAPTVVGKEATVASSTAPSPPPMSPYKPPPAPGTPTTVNGEVSVSAVNGSSAGLKDCSEVCAKDLHACIPACSGGIPCVSGCDDRYRACMKACL